MSRTVEQNAADLTRSDCDNLILAAMFAALALSGLAAYGYHEFRFTLEQRQAAVALTHGDPEHGAVVIATYGCGGCHVIPGIASASGLVGPELGDVARRPYVAGVVANTPANLIAFIQSPRAIDPMSAMPITGISPQEARDAAAYLYSIRD